MRRSRRRKVGYFSWTKVKSLNFILNLKKAVFLTVNFHASHHFLSTVSDIKNQRMFFQCVLKPTANHKLCAVSFAMLHRWSQTRGSHLCASVLFFDNLSQCGPQHSTLCGRVLPGSGLVPAAEMWVASATPWGVCQLSDLTMHSLTHC